MLNDIRIEKITLNQISATVYFYFLRFKIYYMLDIVPSCNLVQYEGNIMTPPGENGKNPNLRPSLDPPKFFPWVLPLLIVRQCSKLSSYAISTKANGPNLKEMTKNLILGVIFAHLAQIWATNLFCRFYLC